MFSHSRLLVLLLILLPLVSFGSACAQRQMNAMMPDLAEVQRQLQADRVAAQAQKQAKEDHLAYRLPNGLTVVMKEDRSAPVVALQMWVQVGGADETDELAGIAHVFEHMLFKGTDKREVGQIAREVSAAGGSVNAYTAHDQTVYHLTLASRHFENGLDILADATQNSTFDPEELAKEREVVVEEIRRGMDSPRRALQETLFGTMFQKHTYGRPVIGSKETVRAMTREDMLEFFDEWYAPNNMTLVLVGDFDTTEARGMVERMFAGAEANPDLKHSRPEEPPQEELRIAQQARDFQQDQVGLAFHIPSVKDEDSFVMDVVSDILTGSSNALLTNELVNTLRIATNVFSYSYTPKDSGAFVAGVTLEPGDREEVVRQSLRIIFGLAHGNVPPRRLALAKTRTAGNFVYGMETTQSLAGQLGWFQVIAGDLQYPHRYLEYIEGLSPAQVASVARKYLHPDNLTIGVVAADGSSLSDEDRLRQIVAEEWEAAAERAPMLDVVERTEIEGTTHVTFENGTVLLVTPDPTLPIISVAGGMLGGLRDEPVELAGISNFMTSMLRQGTETLSREELTDRLEAINGSMSFSTNPDNISFSMRYIQPEGESSYVGLPLLADVIQNASFPDDEMENIRRRLLAEFDQREDNLFQVAVLNYLPMVFGENGYGRMALGDRNVVREMERQQLLDYAERSLRSDVMVVSVVGDVDPDRFIEEYAREFAQHRSTGEFQRKELTLPRHDAPKTTVVEKGRAQSHILYGWPAPSIRGEDRYAFEVLNAIMSGMGGRLFLELRDRQSLAYSVTSILPMRYDAGSWMVYIGTAPDKVDEAIAGIRHQMDFLREKGVMEREVEEAKAFLVGKQAVDLQTRSARASTMLSGQLSDLGFRYSLDEYPGLIDAVTVEDVNRVAREYLDPDVYLKVLVR